MKYHQTQTRRHPSDGTKVRHLIPQSRSSTQPRNIRAGARATKLNSDLTTGLVAATVLSSGLPVIGNAG
ncbi:hypothetical protein DL95DRAFT_108657 [Leptodontidium sp. 2 PMI_412]|nr:hypothetical protein DL95DRAFT_108657 [Leptodontidium sp. 2 PMI_412]